jgi:hypothetical protein
LYYLPSASNGTKPLLTYDQFISISLTAITVVLAVVALLVAYLAFEGKHQLIEKAREIAKQEFEKEKPALYKKIQESISGDLRSLVQQEGDKVVQDWQAMSSTTEISGIPDDVKEIKND